MLKKILMVMVFVMALPLSVYADSKANHTHGTNKANDAGKTSGTNKVAKININTAPIEVLKQIEGIGEKRAGDIISYRNKQKFKSVEELTKIKGITKRVLEKNKGRLTVD